jgi:hypothetical protein
VKDLESLMALSKKASAGTHPAVLSFWKAEDFKPGLEKEGEKRLGAANQARRRVGRDHRDR